MIKMTIDAFDEDEAREILAVVDEIPKKRARHDCPRCRAVWEELTREMEKTSSAPATRDPKEG